AVRDRRHDRCHRDGDRPYSACLAEGCGVSRLGPVRTTLLMKLPAASPHLMTGLRLAVAYSVIGIIAGEFILSTEGIGRRVALAYNNFDNQTMYALLVLILAFAVALNAALGAFEQAPHRRWYRS